jgi:ABC-type Mn2+/Zn2+ transport system permease subunit
MPATLSAVFSSQWGVRLLIAWVVAAIASMAGLAGAYYLDFSVGPVIALCMGMLLAAVGVFAKLRPVWVSRPSRIEGTTMAYGREES